MLVVVVSMWCFFFKQKTAYEMRISDWSSDVCSSDLAGHKVKAALLPAGLCCLMTTAAAPPSAEHVIEMTRMRFGPAPANLKVGDTIVWVNHDIVPHTPTPRHRRLVFPIQPHHSALVTMRPASTIAFYSFDHHSSLLPSLILFYSVFFCF